MDFSGKFSPTTLIAVKLGIPKGGGPGGGGTNPLIGGGGIPFIGGAGIPLREGAGGIPKLSGGGGGTPLFIIKEGGIGGGGGGIFNGFGTDEVKLDYSFEALIELFNLDCSY